MKRFTDISLETGILTDDDKALAGDHLRQFEASPAWFRLQQLVTKERGRWTRVLLERPSTHCIADYAEASGAIQQLDKFAAYFDQIAQEAIKASE